MENSGFNFRSPKLAILLISLPLLIMITGICYTLIPIITRLTQLNILHWSVFTSAHALLALGTAVYSIRNVVLKKTNHPILYPIVFALQTGLLYYFFAGITVFTNSNVPSWMMGEGFIIYLISFIVPVLMFSLINIAEFSYCIINKKYWFVDLGLIFGIPLLTYMSTTLLRHISFNEDIVVHTFIIFFVLITILFFLFCIRFVLFITDKIKGKLIALSFLWKMLFGLIFPIVGLLLNAGFFPFLDIKNIFGDFTNPLFYIIAIINGIALICSPDNGKLLIFIKLSEKTDKVIRFITLTVKSICIPYVFYFLIVFMPFFPFSLFALFAFGLGILVATPSLLFFIEIVSILSDVAFLKPTFKYYPALLAIISILIIPACMFVSFTVEKHNLKRALDYVYADKKDGEIDTKLLTTTLMNVKRLQNNSGFFNMFSNKTPYIDGLYSTIVTQNLTLQKDKIGTLFNTFTEIFDPQYNYKNNFAEIHNLQIELSDYKVKTTFDKTKGFYKSDIELQFHNNNAESTSNDETDDFIVRSNFPGNAEMIADFNLPETAFIGDYFLDIAGTRKKGILTEKRAALWIYEMIKNENKDPGFLRYISKNTLRLKIFPFANNETRTSGFTIYHASPFTFKFYGKEIRLEDSATVRNTIASDIYIDTNKVDHKVIKRNPELNIVFDCSVHSKEKASDYLSIVGNLPDTYGELKNLPKKYYLANYKVTPTTRDNLQPDLIQTKKEGGIVITQVLRSIIKEYTDSTQDTYPIILIVTGSPDKFIISEDITAFTSFIPELSEIFYFSNNTLYSYDMTNRKTNKSTDFKSALDKDCAVYTYKGYNTYYNYKNAGMFITTLSEHEIKTLLQSDKTPDNIIALRLRENYNLLNKVSDFDADLFKASLRQNVLSENTSFIVLEDKAQENILKRKQNEFVNKDTAFDSVAEESGVEMAEPGIVITIISSLLTILAVYFMRKRKLLIKK